MNLLKPKQYVLLLLVFVFYSLKVQADNFIVTSNADSGPGTLREAITQADLNGTASNDLITFNISDISRTGRTIILNGQLPPLFSNLTIDASTQTGSSFGMSDARIILLVNTPRTTEFIFFRFSDASNIEIYGLYMYNSVFTLFSNFAAINGIQFDRCTNIKIGKPGSGNYMRGIRNGIYNFYGASNSTNSVNISIQANIFNNDENGDPIIVSNNNVLTNSMDYAISFSNSKNIKIGGSQIGEGNTIFANNIEIASNVINGNGYLIIEGNKMGTTTDGVFSIQYSTNPINIFIDGDAFPYKADYECRIINNKIRGTVEVDYLTKYFTIQGNKIYSGNSNGSSSGSIFNMKLWIGACTGGGIIGGDLVSQQNEIGSSGPMMSNGQYNSIAHGAIHIAYSENVLIRKNKTYCSAWYGAGITVISSDEPHAQIDSTGINFVRGKATPNCRIEVFKDDDCWACDGIALLGQTVSNADSTWSFTGNFSGVVIATATKNDSTTSSYTAPTYRADSVKIVQPTCGLNNGSIQGVKMLHSWDNVEWHKSIFINGNWVDNIISTNINITNLGPGSYYFVAKLGETCRSAVTAFTLTDFTPQIDEANIIVTNPSCGQSNGSINGINVIQGEFSKHKWVNEFGTVFIGSVSGQIASVFNLPEGKYRLIVTDTTVGCADTSAWRQIVNQSGPTLNTNNIQIVHATCGNNNGKITNITTSNVTGTPFIQWLDSLNNVVGTSLDLINVPSGKYKLKFKDQGGCDTISTIYYNVQSIGEIKIDITNKIVKPAGCTINNGSISNVVVTGATTFQWKKITTNAIVGNNISVFNLAAGSYQLLASNNFGCSITSSSIVLPTAIFSPITVVNPQNQNASCNQTNGSISINSFNNATALLSFKWIDSVSNQIIGNNNQISNLGAGTYLLIAKDTNGCEKQIYKYILIATVKPSIDLTNIQIKDDVCLLRSGSISGIKFNNLVGPTSYDWIKIGSNSVSNNLTLNNESVGQYQLTTTDFGNCIVQSPIFNIANSNISLQAPLYLEQTIVKNTTATLRPIQLNLGAYLLFKDAQGIFQLQNNNNGIFNIDQIASDTAFYVQYISGVCKSLLSKVVIKTLENSSIYIPNSFTPNADGVNDFLKVLTIGNIQLEYFSIYNRYGETIFKSTDINKGWDGSFKANKVENGVFIWVVKARDKFTNKIIQQHGTVLLIR
jgi:gliding motility-associated-like protein